MGSVLKSGQGPFFPKRHVFGHGPRVFCPQSLVKYREQAGTVQAELIKVRKRCNRLALKNEILEERLDAMACSHKRLLDRADDHKELQKEAQKNMSNKGDLADFTDALRSRRQALGGGGSDGGSERGPRRHQVPPSQITHAQAKMLCPPGAFVWRSLTEGQWLGRLPPLGEHSRSWRRYGERAACVLILRILWTEYCELRGAPLSSVPIDMLLFECSTLQPNSASEPATGASGSSSSQAAAAAPARQRNAGAKAAPRNTGSRNVPTASLSEPTSNATSAASEAASSSGQKRQQKRKR